MKIKFFNLLVFLPVILAVSEAVAARNSSHPLDNPGCSEKDAVAAVRTDQVMNSYCSASVNGIANGCDFETRPSDLRERDNVEIAWVVKTSVIHSFSDNGQPVFMPEGATFVYVSKSCEILSTMDALACKPREDGDKCP